jgi:hypothetical protein
MAVSLHIQDGSPWWLSSNLWTVPGDDPEGATGAPIVGTPCFLWAHVENTGSTPVNDAQVRFYWADPSVGFDRTTANPVGVANVTLPAGMAADVLCLTPWIPTFVNDGHECILGEAFHQFADPLPGTPDFNVPTDRHVAQRNLSVVMAMQARMFHASFSVHNTMRKPRAMRIYAKPGRLEELKPLLKPLGRELDLSAKGELARFGFVESACPSEADFKRAKQEVNVDVPARSRRGLTLVGELKGDAALVHVIQEADGRQIGGLSVLVLKGAAEKE